MYNKITIRILCGLLFCQVFTACESDIDLYSDVQSDQVMVYGILDCSANQQLIKIGKMVQLDKTGAIQGNGSVPVDTDSITISIQEWTDIYSATYHLTPSANQPGNLMSHFEGTFKPYSFMDYKLLITNKNTGDLIIASTTPLEDPRFVYPPENSICWIGYSLEPFSVRYQGVPNGYLYQLTLTIQYADFTAAGDTIFREGLYAFDPQYYDHPPATMNYRFTLNKSFSPEEMIDIFASLVSMDANIKSRQVYRFIFTSWAGNSDLRDYLKMSTTYEDNRKQAFTNIIGGFGVFGATSHATLGGLYPDADFLTDLSENELTRQLKFEPRLFKGVFTIDQSGSESIPCLTNHENN